MLIGVGTPAPHAYWNWVPRLPRTVRTCTTSLTNAEPLWTLPGPRSAPEQASVPRARWYGPTGRPRRSRAAGGPRWCFPSLAVLTEGRGGHQVVKAQARRGRAPVGTLVAPGAFALPLPPHQRPRGPCQLFPWGHGCLVRRVSWLCA